MVVHKNSFRGVLVCTDIHICCYMVRAVNQAKKIRKALMKAVENRDRLAIAKALRRLECEKNRWKNGKLNTTDT